VVLGADFGAGHLNVALTDLMGDELAVLRTEIDIADGPEAGLTALLTAADTLLSGYGRDRDDLIGVGIGLPGPVQFSTGRPVNPPIMPGWDGFDVPGWVRRHLDVPVLVDNDVNIMALGERGHAFPDTDHFLFVKVATGIGSGIISGGRLQRGAQGIAGDIGHVQIPRGAGIACHCGNVGCLELVRRGDIDAIQAVRQAGRDLGEVLTACVNVINPSVIAIGGSMAQAGEHLIAGVREIVYTRSMPLATEHLSIVQSRSGDRAAMIGASMLAIHHALSPAAIDELAALV
jgi:predicted NBD/HSP70 family sugar kinase